MHWRDVWLFIAFTIIVLFLTALAIIAADAREQYPGQYAQVDPAIADWYSKQIVPGGANKGGGCCSMADGAKAESDVRIGHDGQLHWFARFEACYFPGNYLPKICHDVDWMEVPDDAVIEFSRNPTGSTVVWYTVYFNAKTQTFTAVEIRCFARESEI